MMNEYTGRKSDLIFNSLNRINEAKQTGVMVNDELSKVLILEGDLFANQVKNGKRTEEEIESFETLIPKTNVFVHKHIDLDVAYNTVKQNNTAALLERVNRFEFYKRI